MPGPLDLAADLALHLVVARDDELDGVVTESLRELARLAAVDRAYVTLLYDDGTFENSHEWTVPHAIPHRPAIQRLRADRFRYSVDLALRNEVMDAPDIEALPSIAENEHDSFASFGIRSVLQVPIRVDERTVGLIGFNAVRPVGAWQDDLIETARRVGQAIGVALLRKRATHAIRTARDDAERANRAKDELLASVSHELRTPLHAVLGFAELLELGAQSEGDREALLEIQFNGRRLLRLVDDLLDLAATGGGTERVETVAALDVVNEVIEILGPAADLRQVSFTTTDVLERLVLDVAPARLRQVVHCLLSGALQILDAGGSVRIGRLDHASGPLASQPALAVTVAGADRAAAAGLITPLARALMDGFGSVGVETAEDGVATVAVVFDQVARP